MQCSLIVFRSTFIIGRLMKVVLAMFFVYLVELKNSKGTGSGAEVDSSGYRHILSTQNRGLFLHLARTRD